MSDPDTVTDPQKALAMSARRLQAQQEMGPWVRHVIDELETLRRDNHIADRMENLYVDRRWRR